MNQHLRPYLRRLRMECAFFSLAVGLTAGTGVLLVLLLVRHFRMDAPHALYGLLISILIVNNLG